METPPNFKSFLIKTPTQLTESVPAFGRFFTDLHKIIKDQALKPEDRHLSFEVWLEDQYFTYRFYCPSALAATVSSIFYAHFKDVQIEQVNDLPIGSASTTSLYEAQFERFSYFPLNTTGSPTQDPYVILATLVSQLTVQETVRLQIVLKPFSESWMAQLIRENIFGILGWLNGIKLFFEKPFLEKDSIQYYDEVKRKFGSKLFQTTIRVLVSGETQEPHEAYIHLVKKALAKLDNGDINGLMLKPLAPHARVDFLARRLTSKPLLLNTAELAALYHFPDQELHITNVDHQTYTRLEAPLNLPKAAWLSRPEISTFGQTNFRDAQMSFGIKRSDRNRHLYIVGKTGMGKTKLIELLAIANMHAGKGLCVIDPHGDLAVDLLRYVPADRIDDVIYFDPADREFPIGFNPLACFTPEAKYQVVSGFIGIFKKLFAAQWSNRLEHMLRFIVLALVEVGDCTVLDIVRLLTEVEFRHRVIAKLKDPVVKNFWTHEFAAWNEKFDNEAIIPIINQVGQFIANDYIRNVVGQTRSAIDFSQVMQNRKILIVNLAKGKLGEENTALLGSMLITKIQEATMARVSLPEIERQDFYLYVDEFQHFATEAFNQILSEARKFNLSLTIAHQYLDQLTESIRKTVFGNVGSFVSFRVGPEDGEFLETEFRPTIGADDLVNLDARHMYVKLSIDGKTSLPFSAISLDFPTASQDQSTLVVQKSQAHYGTPKDQLVTDQADVDDRDGSFEEPLV